MISYTLFKQYLNAKLHTANDTARIFRFLALFIRISFWRQFRARWQNHQNHREICMTEKNGNMLMISEHAKRDRMHIHIYKTNVCPFFVYVLYAFIIIGFQLHNKTQHSITSPEIAPPLHATCSLSLREQRPFYAWMIRNNPDINTRSCESVTLRCRHLHKTARRPPPYFGGLGGGVWSEGNMKTPLAYQHPEHGRDMRPDTYSDIWTTYPYCRRWVGTTSASQRQSVFVPYVRHSPEVLMRCMRPLKWFFGKRRRRRS